MKEYGFDTLQLHAGQEPDPTTKSRALPIYMTSSYVFDNSAQGASLFNLEIPGNIYTRLMNPTTDVMEKRLAALEGGVAAVATSSGTSAVLYALLNVANSGSEIISCSTLYGGTYTLLSARFEPQFGIKTHLIHPDDLEGIERAINEKTRCLYFETLGNPDINLPDIEALCKLAHAHGLPVIVDNTFGTPYLINLKQYGVDVVVHSLTKYMGGHGTALGGAIVDMGTFDWHNPRFPQFTQPDEAYHGLVYADADAPFALRSRVYLVRDTGACISPFNSFLITQGMETLSLRVDRHCQNALALAEFLKKHPAVDWVHYPALKGDKYYERAQKYLPKGSGAIFTFGVKGGATAGIKFIDSLKLFSLLANVADAKSLVIHPAGTTHSQLSPDEMKAAGVLPEMIRMSIGLESIEDIIADVEQALIQSQK